MRIKISFSRDGSLVQDQGEVNNFPPALWEWRDEANRLREGQEKPKESSWRPVKLLLEMPCLFYYLVARVVYPPNPQNKKKSTVIFFG